ncbi:MAG: type VI secretion system-associated protein TagF [Methylococcales bacterium]|nr:type VI secretion system-associated protein TagF [Methylococcaceae bacterium]
MSGADYQVGFYGKLPSHGDFLSRRLPRQFIEPWDHWLQGGLSASKEQLGRQWLNTFLVSPIWQFALAKGICGDDAWAGVMMPSVDRVGRYFPFSLAVKVNDIQLTRLFSPECGWFDALSQLAFSTLEYEFDLDVFESQLEKIRLGDFLDPASVISNAIQIRSGSGRLAFEFRLDSDQTTPRAFAELGDQLSSRFLENCSYWRSAATAESNPVLLLCEGLPPSDAYIGFLSGAWPERGWLFFSKQLKDLVVSDTVNNYSPPSESSRLNQLSSEAAQPQAIAVTDIVVSAALQNSQPPLINVFQYESCALSVVGLRRKLNEDAILERKESGLWVVADGMGGHSAGDVASQAVVDALAKIPFVDDLEHYSEQVASSLHAVNVELLKLAESRGHGQVIGSTVVVLLMSRHEFRYLWAGDSRLYLFRQGVLAQLTLDHSLYNESINLGMPLVDGSLEQGRGNIITRAVGAENQLQLDFGQGDIDANDVFILSSDGLDKELSHAEIAALCTEGSASDIAHRLIHEAESKGGRDNISVIVVKT